MNDYFNEEDIKFINEELKDLSDKTIEAFKEYFIMLARDCGQNKIAKPKDYFESIENEEEREDMIYIRSHISALNNITTNSNYYPAIIALSIYKQYRALYGRDWILENPYLENKPYQKCIKYFIDVDSEEERKIKAYKELINSKFIDLLSIGYDFEEDAEINNTNDLKLLDKFNKKYIKDNVSNCRKIS